MKKVLLVFALTLALVSAFAAVALADQTHDAVDTTATNQGVYLPVDPDNLLATGYSAIHSDYTANTDACASCHSVHNAQEQDFLLQWSSTSVACKACHDGTITATYDVIGGTIADTLALTAGGNFAVTDGSIMSASEHGVFGNVLVSSAPGGKGAEDLGLSAEDIEALTPDQYGSWSAEETFSCASCHEPHGAAGNFRLLNPNPNLIMSQGRVQEHGATAPQVYGSTDVSMGAGDGAKKVFNFAKRPILADFPIAVKVNGSVIANTDYKIGFDGTTKIAYVEFDTAPAASAAVTADYTPALTVDATFVGTKLTEDESIKYGAGMTQFCTACHTDYAGKRSSSQSVYDTANKYHHTGDRVNSNGFIQLGNSVSGSTGSCLTCHYGHGVDQNRWAKTATATGISAFNHAELDGSSALKRLPNMGVCEVCHRQELRSYSSNNLFQQIDGVWKQIGN